MECAHCHSKWDTNPTIEPDYCPFCGSPYSSKARELAAKKPAGFDYTWGLVHEDQLNKSRSRDKAEQSKMAQMALDSFLKSVQTNPDDGLHTALFLLDHADLDFKLDEIEVIEPFDKEDLENSLNILKPAQRAAIYLMLAALKNGNLQAGLMLEYQMKRFAMTYPELKAAFNTKINGPAASFILSHDNNQPLVSSIMACLYAFNDNPTQAVESLAHLYDAKFFLYDPKDIEFFAGLPMEKDARIEYVRKKKEEPDGLNEVLMGLYHPLALEDHEFDHLPALVDETLNYLKANEKAWLERSMDLLEKGILLRGIHLVLQQIRNLDKQYEPIAPLLDKHYEKIYMQPYEIIQKSDFILG